MFILPFYIVSCFFAHGFLLFIINNISKHSPKKPYK